MKNIWERIVVYSILFTFLSVVIVQLRSYNDTVNSIFDLMRDSNTTGYVTQDLMLRTFHYVKPHKPYEFISNGNGFSMPMCPECVKILQEIGMYNEPGQWISEKDYKEYLKIKEMMGEKETNN